MPIQLKQFTSPADEKSLSASSHVLFVLPPDKPARMPYGAVLEKKLKRSHSKYSDLAKTPMSSDLPHGGPSGAPSGAIASWVVLDAKHNAFQRHTLLRKALKTLLDEKPQTLAIAVFGDDAFRKAAACDAFYVASVNAAELPSRKKSKDKPKLLKTIALHG